MKRECRRMMKQALSAWHFKTTYDEEAPHELSAQRLSETLPEQATFRLQAEWWIQRGDEDNDWNFACYFAKAGRRKKSGIFTTEVSSSLGSGRDSRTLHSQYQYQFSSEVLGDSSTMLGDLDDSDDSDLSDGISGRSTSHWGGMRIGRYQSSRLLTNRNLASSAVSEREEFGSSRFSAQRKFMHR